MRARPRARPAPWSQIDFITSAAPLARTRLVRPADSYEDDRYRDGTKLHDKCGGPSSRRTLLPNAGQSRRQDRDGADEPAAAHGQSTPTITLLALMMA